MTAQRWRTETYLTSPDLRELMFASLNDSRGMDRLGPASVVARFATTELAIQPAVSTCSTGRLPDLSLAPPVEPTHTLPGYCECHRAWCPDPDPEAA